MLINRTPRSTIRRANRQARANDGLLGSAPYISRVARLSLRRSISSGAEVSNRSAISYDAIRVAISGSPTTSSRLAIERSHKVERVALQARHSLREGERR